MAVVTSALMRSAICTHLPVYGPQRRRRRRIIPPITPARRPRTPAPAAAIAVGPYSRGSSGGSGVALAVGFGEGVAVGSGVGVGSGVPTTSQLEVERDLDPRRVAPAGVQSQKADVVEPGARPVAPRLGVLLAVGDVALDHRRWILCGADGPFREVLDERTRRRVEVDLDEADEIRHLVRGHVALRRETDVLTGLHFDGVVEVLGGQDGVPVAAGLEHRGRVERAATDDRPVRRVDPLRRGGPRREEQQRDSSARARLTPSPCGRARRPRPARRARRRPGARPR